MPDWVGAMPRPGVGALLGGRSFIVIVCLAECWMAVLDDWLCLMIDVHAKRVCSWFSEGRVVCGWGCGPVAGRWFWGRLGVYKWGG